LAIAHILWVCGPGAAGKSSFLRQLAAGQLPAQIIDRLPAGSETWPQLKAKDLHFADYATLPPRFAVHYSLTQALRHFSRFENDPLLQIFNLANDITVVHIKPSEDRIVSQWLHRRNWKRQRTARQSSIRTALRAAMSLRLDRSRTRVARTMAVYSAPAFCEEAWQARKRRTPRCSEVPVRLYQSWEHHLRQGICLHRPITELFIRPDPTSRPGDVRWVPTTPGQPTRLAAETEGC
jgi:hypothetical protein